MATSSSLLLLKQLVIKLLLFSAANSYTVGVGCYTSIISFGDSLADTGNQVLLSRASRYSSSPYGRTYFHHPTGRCSDGRLVIDFIAEYLGLPLVPPYFGGNINNGGGFTGVNFAVAGATVLDEDFFEKRGVANPTNISLRVQLDLFKKLLPSLCSTTPECNNLLDKSLILMGEIGGNDYNNPFFQGLSFHDIREFVPLVIDAIAAAIHELIDQGARTFLVPGNLPIGCIPIYLTFFQTWDTRDYDPLTGCINWLNEFAEYHNKMLQIKLNHILLLHPHVNIIYADYYNAAMRLYRSPRQFGFTGGVLTACCGRGGPYNYNSSLTCGSPLIDSCSDPSLYVNWDGIHMTEAAYKLMFQTISNTMSIIVDNKCFKEM